MNPLVSIVIATFNSEHLLPRVLKSIQSQSFKKDLIEILIIDGGSSDATTIIGKKSGCSIIHNPSVEPLYAKYLGYVQAKGKYIMYLDHDEVLLNAACIEERLSIFKQNPAVKALTGSGYYSPEGYHVINSYINEFGDPFSFFMYHLSKHADFFMPTMMSRYTVVKETKSYVIFDISGSRGIPLVELVAGGGMFDRGFVVKNFPELLKKHYLLPHVLHIISRKSPMLAISKKDPILHFSSDTINSYIKKLVWRIKNNIYFKNTTGSSGYNGRAEYSKVTSVWKTALFVPYAFSLVFPLYDAFVLMVSRRRLSYVLHVPLTVLTAILIVHYYVLKIFGFQPQLGNYDGSTIAYEIK